MIANQACRPFDPKLLDYCTTDNQREIYAAYGKHGTVNETSRKLGKDSSAVSQAIRAIQKKANAAGYTPQGDFTALVGDGQTIIGKSTFTKDPDGNPVWIKTKADVEKQQEAFRQYIDSLCAEIKPAKPIATPKGVSDKSLLSAIFIGDAHVGMYAYAPETKHTDFDSDIAAKGLRDAIDDLISRSPNAEQGMLVDVGDFMHANSSLNKTYAGTDVDVDTRYSRVLEIAGQVMQYAVSQMLKKFQKVIVVIAKGNHNPDAAVAVQQITKAYFHKEPRVEILKTIGFFHYIEWGNWLIGVNHGDKVKAPKLVNVMARDMAQAWGRTTHRMWAIGHFHHEKVTELDGCTIHQFGALPPPDGWHASMGYGGDGQMQMITFKKEGGKHSTLIYDLPRPNIQPDAVLV